MEQINLAFYLAFGFIFFSCFAGLAWYLYQASQDRKVERHLKITRFHYDRQGNPEYFYDPITGAHFLPAPGNNPTAPAENVIFHPVRVEAYQRQRQEPQIKVWTDPASREALPAENEPEKLLPALPDSDRKLLLDLASALEGGASDRQAIIQVTGQKGGRKYARATELLDLLRKGAIEL